MGRMGYPDREIVCVAGVSRLWIKVLMGFRIQNDFKKFNYKSFKVEKRWSIVPSI